MGELKNGKTSDGGDWYGEIPGEVYEKINACDEWIDQSHKKS